MYFFKKKQANKCGTFLTKSITGGQRPTRVDFEYYLWYGMKDM